jgi:hypothetical protein
MKKRGEDGLLVKEEIFIFVEFGCVGSRYLEILLNTAHGIGSEVCGTAMESIWILLWMFSF